MDRSFLTDTAVVRASRDFVCIRLATYEDSQEARYLKTIFTSRSGVLENTVFCLLAPDGKTKLSRPGRGPRMAFRSPRDMASEMAAIAADYPARSGDGVARLPQLKNFRLGLNVAECDRLPLVVCLAENEDQMQSLHDQLAPLAFSDRLSGRFVYASVDSPSDLKSIAGDTPESGYLVIAPGEFGIDGALQQQIAPDVDRETLEDRLATFAETFRQRDKDHRQHVRRGHENGIDWQTEIPVTDPMSNRARERTGPGGEKQRGKKRRDR